MNVEVVQKKLWEQSQQHRDHRLSDTPLFPVNQYDGRVRNLMDLMHQPQWIAAACDRVLQRSRGKAALLRQLRTGDLLAESSDTVSGVPQAENPCELMETLWKAGCLEILHVRFGVGAQVRSLGLHHNSSAVNRLVIAWLFCSRSWRTQSGIILSRLRMCVISW